MAKPLILLAAGGTGGHLFPAEALGVVLMQRGLRVRRRKYKAGGDDEGPRAQQKSVHVF